MVKLPLSLPDKGGLCADPQSVLVAREGSDHIRTTCGWPYYMYEKGVVCDI